jgi:colanic acid biosynthesis glycosyl transferase WcaI
MILANRPAAVIVSNAPLLAHALLAIRLSRKRIPMIFWQQDIYSSAIGNVARAKVPVLGSAIAWVAERVERNIARASAAVVAISPTFLEKLTKWGVAEKTTVIPNWAPIDELPVCNRRNPWSEKMGLSDVPVVLYSGTLGLKHDPSILSLISTAMSENDPSARLVVISQGKGRDWLEGWRQENSVQNLILMDFQRYAEFPYVLASADVLVAILEPEASKFSVPSKILTYMCAQRPIVGVLPSENSVAQVLLGHSAGVVVDPIDRAGIGAAIVDLLNNPDHRQTLSIASRQYAEREFSSRAAAMRFAEILRKWVRIPEQVSIGS